MRRTLLLVPTLLVFLAPAVHATSPGIDGRIAFERLRYENTPWGELFVTNADGSRARRLTHPPRGTENSQPDWSPDGQTIVFTNQPPRGAFSIWTVGADGGDLRRLSPPCPSGAGIPKCPADDGWPVWSPDGKHLAFQRLSGALTPKGATVNDATAIYKDELVVTDAAGQHTRTLVWVGPWRGDPQSPAWSPDGTRLVFIGKFMASKTNGSGCECRALYVVNADGSGLRRITTPGLRPGGRPDWAPDGNRILFRTHPGDDPSGVGSNLYTIRPDGTSLRQLTHITPAAHVLEGSYSPEGSSIVFQTSQGATGGTLTDVFVMNADGSGMHPITHTKQFEDDADWGPPAK